MFPKYSDNTFHQYTCWDEIVWFRHAYEMSLLENQMETFLGFETDRPSDNLHTVNRQVQIHTQLPNTNLHLVGYSKFQIRDTVVVEVLLYLPAIVYSLAPPFLLKMRLRV